MYILKTSQAYSISITLQLYLIKLYDDALEQEHRDKSNKNKNKNKNKSNTQWTDDIDAGEGQVECEGKEQEEGEGGEQDEGEGEEQDEGDEKESRRTPIAKSSTSSVANTQSDNDSEYRQLSKQLLGIVSESSSLVDIEGRNVGRKIADQLDQVSHS